MHSLEGLLLYVDSQAQFHFLATKWYQLVQQLLYSLRGHRGILKPLSYFLQLSRHTSRSPSLDVSSHGGSFPVANIFSSLGVAKVVA